MRIKGSSAERLLWVVTVEKLSVVFQYSNICVFQRYRSFAACHNSSSDRPLLGESRRSSFVFVLLRLIFSSVGLGSAAVVDQIITWPAASGQMQPFESLLSSRSGEKYQQTNQPVIATAPNPENMLCQRGRQHTEAASLDRYRLVWADQPLSF